MCRRSTALKTRSGAWRWPSPLSVLSLEPWRKPPLPPATQATRVTFGLNGWRGNTIQPRVLEEISCQLDKNRSSRGVDKGSCPQPTFGLLLLQLGRDQQVRAQIRKGTKILGETRLERMQNVVKSGNLSLFSQIFLLLLAYCEIIINKKQIIICYYYYYSILHNIFTNVL